MWPKRLPELLGHQSAKKDFIRHICRDHPSCQLPESPVGIAYWLHRTAGQLSLVLAQFGLVIRLHVANFDCNCEKGY